MAVDKFNMPRNVAETIDKLHTAAERVRMWDAICRYEFYDIKPDFSGDELALFEKLRAKVDAMNGGKRNGKK